MRHNAENCGQMTIDDVLEPKKPEDKKEKKPQENQSKNKGIGELLAGNVDKLYGFLDSKIYEESKGRSEEKSVILKEADIQLERIISTPEVAQEIEKIKDRFKFLSQEIERLSEKLQDYQHVEGVLMKHEAEKKKIEGYIEAINSIENNITL